MGLALATVQAYCMKFESIADKNDYNAFSKLFGVPFRAFTQTERSFYRNCSLTQATLTGYNISVKKRYEQIHKRGLTVDHIVPLWGCNAKGDHVVCGLNVPWNLRGETKKNNCKKGNLFVDNADAIGIIVDRS